jgi:aspartate racemase
MRPNLTLGVLGGMGPSATADFLRVLAEKTPAHTDQEHPRMIVYSNTITPDRTTYILGKGPDPTEYIKNGLLTLVGWGADLLCVTCNTAHFFIDQFRDDIPKPIVHIIDETIIKSSEVSPNGAWLTATLGTMKTQLYQTHAKNSGYNFRIPSYAMQVEIHDVTDMVKAGDHKGAGKKFEEIVNRLWEIEKLPIVGACTEIPIAYANTSHPTEMGISCLEALADGCIKRLYFNQK